MVFIVCSTQIYIIVLLTSAGYTWDFFNIFYHLYHPDDIAQILMGTGLLSLGIAAKSYIYRVSIFNIRLLDLIRFNHKKSFHLILWGYVPTYFITVYLLLINCVVPSFFSLVLHSIIGVIALRLLIIYVFFKDIPQYKFSLFKNLEYYLQLYIFKTTQSARKESKNKTTVLYDFSYRLKQSIAKISASSNHDIEQYINRYAIMMMTYLSIKLCESQNDGSTSEDINSSDTERKEYIFSEKNYVIKNIELCKEIFETLLNSKENGLELFCDLLETAYRVTAKKQYLEFLEKKKIEFNVLPLICVEIGAFFAIASHMKVNKKNKLKKFTKFVLNKENFNDDLLNKFPFIFYMQFYSILHNTFISPDQKLDHSIYRELFGAFNKKLELHNDDDINELKLKYFEWYFRVEHSISWYDYLDKLSELAFDNQLAFNLILDNSAKSDEENETTSENETKDMYKKHYRVNLVNSVILKNYLDLREIYIYDYTTTMDRTQIIQDC